MDLYRSGRPLLILFALCNVVLCQENATTTGAAATSTSAVQKSTSTTGHFTGSGTASWSVSNKTTSNRSCIYMRAEITLDLNFNVTDGVKKQIVNVPKTATVVEDESFCDDDDFPEQQRLVIDLFGTGKWKLSLDFAHGNSLIGYTKLGSANWMQFSLYQVVLTYDLTDFDEFAGATEPAKGKITGQTDGTNEDENLNWRRLYSAIDGNFLKCTKPMHIVVKPDRLTFHTEQMKLMAWGSAAQGSFPPGGKMDLCYADKGQSDAAAVIIGALETIILLLILVGYLVYLKKRGPVTVPNYLIEPAMRKARVKAMSTADYDRRVSHLSPPGDGLQQRHTAGAEAEKDKNEHPY